MQRGRPKKIITAEKKPRELSHEAIKRKHIPRGPYSITGKYLDDPEPLSDGMLIFDCDPPDDENVTVYGNNI